MKKRYIPILTFTVAILLVGSIAYAADKRKKTKSAIDDLNKISEDEALQVELLAAVEDQHKLRPDTIIKTSNDTGDTSIVLDNEGVEK